MSACCAYIVLFFVLNSKKENARILVFFCFVCIELRKKKRNSWFGAKWHVCAFLFVWNREHVLSLKFFRLNIVSLEAFSPYMCFLKNEFVPKLIFRQSVLWACNFRPDSVERMMGVARLLYSFWIGFPQENRACLSFLHSSVTRRYFLFSAFHEAFAVAWLVIYPIWLNRQPWGERWPINIQPSPIGWRLSCQLVNHSRQPLELDPITSVNLSLVGTCP